MQSFFDFTCCQHTLPIFRVFFYIFSVFFFLTHFISVNINSFEHNADGLYIKCAIQKYLTVQFELCFESCFLSVFALPLTVGENLNAARQVCGQAAGEAAVVLGQAADEAMRRSLEAGGAMRRSLDTARARLQRQDFRNLVNWSDPYTAGTVHLDYNYKQH